MNKRAQALCVLFLTIGAPAIANAHVSLEHGLVAGLVHPLTGLDHWVTLLAAGFLAQRIRGAARILVPVLLVLALLVDTGPGPTEFVAGLLITSVVLIGVGMLLASTVTARISAARSALGMPLRQASRAWKD